MTYCINPHCPKSIDPVNANNLICRNCGSEILLQGRYRVLKQLGQGGFGNTFEVDECGKTKVLKVLTENNPKAIEMLPKYPASVAVAASANYLWSPADVDNVINCFTTQSASSQECKGDPFASIAPGEKMGENYSMMTTAHLSDLIITKGYNFYVCPSCVVTHDNIVSSETIISAFIQWFLRIEKPKRREIISLLGNQNESGILRDKIANESTKAVNEYWKVRARVEQQEQERRRQELLGN